MLPALLEHAKPLLQGLLGRFLGYGNGKPYSNSFVIEADWVPFGKDNSWGRPLANLKLGIQYTIYTEFNEFATGEVEAAQLNHAEAIRRAASG